MRIGLVQASCQRCGRKVMTASRSPLGLDGLKARWGVVCQSCTTPEEEQQLLREQASALLGWLRVY